MKLTVLGSCGAFPEKNRACSGYLLEAGRAKIVIDLGSGTLANLQNHIDVSEINAVVFSHMHPDHFTDIYLLRYLLEYGIKLERPLDLWGVEGFDKVIIRLQPESEEAFRSLFNFNVIAGSFAIKDLTIDTAAAAHPVESLLFRFNAGKSLVYSGDTGYTDVLAQIAKGSDVLLVESTFLSDGPEPLIHLRSTDAAKLALTAGVKYLILTHFWPGTDRLKAYDEASEVFAGNIGIASENSTFFL